MGFRRHAMRYLNAGSQCSSGFSLIEVMIVVVIIGIVTAIGYPSYRGHVVKSNRAAAQSFMLNLSSREEQLMLDQRRYEPPGDSTATGVTLGNAPINLSVPTEVSRYYTVSVTTINSATPPSYTISSVPIAGTIQAGDGTMTLDNTGTKTPANLWK